MEANDRLDVGAATTDFERGGAAEAVADHCESRRIDLVLRCEGLERLAGPETDAGPIGAPRRQPARRLGRIGERLAVAVVVHGERRVAQTRQPRCDLLGVLGEPVALVTDQDAWPAAAF